MRFYDKIIILLLIFPSICFADMSGYLFLGKYLNHKQQDLEGRKVNFHAGIYLEYKTKWPTLFIKEETLIEDIENNSSYPNQINYTIGLRHKIYNFDIILKHECLHPVDGTSNGRKAESYNLIEGRFNF